MRYQEKCECCGHIKTAFTHKLNKELVKGLRQLVDFYNDTRSAANLQRHLNLTKSQYNNFQKLQYFGLVNNTPNGWYPTKEGILFIAGELDILDLVATIESRVLPLEHPAWKTHKGKKPRLNNIRNIHLLSYKPRSEYQLEKSRQPNLFS